MVKVSVFPSQLVLLILCVEPAQKASSPALANECLEALKNGWIDPRDSAYNCACQNLHMILQTLDIGQITTNDKGVLSDIISIVKYVAEWNKYIEDLDDYLPLLSSCIILLRHARAREEILNANLDHCFTVFQDASERLQTLQPDNDTIEQKPLLEGAQRELLEILCDVANGANASILNEQGSKSWRILRNWLGTNKEQVPEACFVCASLFLGNLARKDTVCESLVQEHNVHTYLIEHLQITNDHHALHAGGGCLRNISVPQKNKEMIAEAGAFVVIMLLLQLNEMRGLPYVGACIARQLINSSFSNVKRLISTNAQSRPDSVPRSCLDALLQASIESDDFAVKAEVARAIPAVFRVLSGAKEVEDTIDDVRRQIISHPDILSPVMAVLQQEKSQPLRSEGWFTLALIAQSNEGAKIVAEALGDEDILRILREQMKGGEIDGQREESTLQKGADKERENAIVLVTSLLQKDGAIDGHRMPETQRENFENLLKEQKVGLLKS